MPKIFAIRGFMKSGTNWICNILKLHPQISCVGEFHWERVTEAVVDMFDRSSEISAVENLRHETWSSLTQLIERTTIAANRPDAIWSGDRTPGFIHPLIFPGGRFINVIRDGRDVLVSKFFHLYNHPEISYRFNEEPELEERLRRFQEDRSYFKKNPNELFASETEFKNSLRLWKETVTHNQQMALDFPDVPILNVRYESVHADPQTQRNRMYEFLDLDPKLAGALDNMTQPGFDKERPKAFFRKGSVGDWKNYFGPESKEWFKEIAGDTLIENGYQADENW